MGDNINSRIESIEAQIKKIKKWSESRPETTEEMLSYLEPMLEELKQLKVSSCSLGQTTCNNFQTEKEAEQFFDSCVNSDFFVAEKQVKGRRIYDDKPQKADQQNGQNLKPDRILYPTKLAFDSGWKWGPIGVEIKKSDIKVGPVFTQVLEQRQALYYSKHLHGARIMPMIFAIFPTEQIKYDIHSISERQLIVSCRYNDKYRQLQFCTHSRNILSISEDGIWVNSSWMPSTSKGHQGPQK